jgi:hypothetical protein
VPRDHACVTSTKSEAAAAVGLALRKRNELLGLLRPCFARTGPWLQAGKYVPALASDLPRGERLEHRPARAAGRLPREHIEDPVKSLVMGLPLDLAFRTKGQLAIDISTEAAADGIRPDFYCGDEVHGNCTQLREYFEAEGQAYVLRVPSNFTLTLAADTKLTCAQAVTTLLKHKRRWEVRSAGSGSKGQRWYARAWLATASPRRHLLIRRHLRTGELAFCYCFVPDGQLLTKTRLIKAAGLRWPVEEDFAFSKDCFALDQCQARLYTAIARHALLVMAALAICAITAALVKDRTDTQAPPPHRARPAATRRARHDPADHPGDQAAGRRPDHPAATPLACHSLGRMDPPPPGPLPMVPQTRQTRPRRRALPGQLAKCGCLTRAGRH